MEDIWVGTHGWSDEFEGKKWHVFEDLTALGAR